MSPFYQARNRFDIFAPYSLGWAQLPQLDCASASSPGLRLVAGSCGVRAFRNNFPELAISPQGPIIHYKFVTTTGALAKSIAGPSMRTGWKSRGWGRKLVRSIRARPRVAVPSRLLLAA
jgi:hypothetical protein